MTGSQLAQETFLSVERQRRTFLQRCGGDLLLERSADYLYGGNDNDVLEGVGNDNLNGDAKTDILSAGWQRHIDGRYWAAGCTALLGWGQDTINNYDASARDAIEFAADIAPDDIQITRSGYDLILGYWFDRQGDVSS